MIILLRKKRKTMRLKEDNQSGLVCYIYYFKIRSGV